MEIVAQFDVTCYTLTVTGRAHRVTLLPEPNCPGAPRSSLADGVLTARYVGGTPVALVGEVPGGNVWQGWAGDLVETGRVAVAVAIMDQDRAAEHRYRDKTTGEQVTEAFESIGNGIAIAMKKVVGGVMFAANEALFGAPPLGVISTVTAGISLVGMALEAAGVPSSVTKYFDYPAQTISMMSALMGCAASWGIAGNGGASAGGLGADRAAPVLDAYGVVSDTRDVATELADASSDAAAWLAVARANYGSVAKAMDAAGAAMDVAGTAIAAYQLFTSGPGAGWDASASAAWTDFSTYTSCFASNIPDYLRGAVGGSDEYWADIDREWG